MTAILNILIVKEKIIILLKQFVALLGMLLHLLNNVLELGVYQLLWRTRECKQNQFINYTDTCNLT